MALPQDDKNINKRLLGIVRARYAKAQAAEGGASVEVPMLGSIFANTGGCLTATYGVRVKREFQFDAGNFNSEAEAATHALEYLEAERASRQGQFPAPVNAPHGVRVRLITGGEAPIAAVDMLLEPENDVARNALLDTSLDWQAQPWQETGGGAVPNLMAFLTTTSLFDVTLRLDFAPYVDANVETLERLAGLERLDALVRGSEDPARVSLPAPADAEEFLLRAADAMRQDNELAQADPYPSRSSPLARLVRWLSGSR